MKPRITHYRRGILVAALLAFIVMGSLTQVMADGPHYRHDDHGYWDNHRVYHHWEYYHSHRGYWGYQNGVRVFIVL